MDVSLTFLFCGIYLTFSEHLIYLSMSISWQTFFCFIVKLSLVYNNIFFFKYPMVYCCESVILSDTSLKPHLLHLIGTFINDKINRNVCERRELLTLLIDGKM